MHHKRLILSVIITSFFLFLIKDVFILNKPIKLVFYADGSQETEFKIYYTTNKTEQYKGIKLEIFWTHFLKKEVTTCGNGISMK